MSTIIVTGAAGFIGGQISLMLRDAGHRVVGIDRRYYPEHLVGVFERFIHNDFASDHALNALIQEHPVAIIHCAATSLVGPSMKWPADYYNNNVVKTHRMLDVVIQSVPNVRVIFSSSAAVYGDPLMGACHEVDPTEPINPYGKSKRMTEMMLESYLDAYNLDYVAFRYFNACGADSLGRHGEENDSTHIIARMLECVKDKKEFELFGNDYPTEDGTCIRDYVHVEDIARAHLMALDLTKIPAGIYNLGSNQGTSNHEIIIATQQVTTLLPEIKVGPRRPGDPATLTASSAKFDAVAGTWRRWNLNDMIRHTWEWYNR